MGPDMPVSKVGTAPGSEPKISLPSSGTNGITPLTSWPKAGELISEDDVRTILPDATDITRTSSNQQIKITGGSVSLKCGVDLRYEVRSAAPQLQHAVAP